MRRWPGLPRRPARRIAAFGATLAALVGLFWLAVDYGSEYAAPLLPYGLQRPLGESVFDELVADKDAVPRRAPGCRR